MRPAGGLCVCARTMRAVCLSRSPCSCVDVCADHKGRAHHKLLHSYYSITASHDEHFFRCSKESSSYLLVVSMRSPFTTVPLQAVAHDEERKQPYYIESIA